MPIDWLRLRPLDGSQQTAFEELCCQLAGHVSVPAGSEFVRKGTPDAGAECYWTLPDGNEWAWQAKFFLTTPGPDQWKQVDESVKTVLEKHPSLVDYTICMPLDRSDPRISKQQWFMDKWTAHVTKWKQWANERGMSVEFRYWGSHEIFRFLTLEEHHGRFQFWFNKEIFSDAWFQAHLHEVAANAGARYTPELHVELPISRIFDALGRTKYFFIKIRRLYGVIRKLSLSLMSDSVLEHRFSDELSKLDTSVQLLLAQLKSIPLFGQAPFRMIMEQAERIQRNAESISSLVLRLPRESPNEHDARTSNLRRLISNLQDLIEFSGSTEAELFNVGALLVVGDAGTGKTHLFCDLAVQRIDRGLPTVMFLGQQFNTDEPWRQMINKLGLSCSRDEFLGALDSSAESRGTKALIIIDALNEGHGKQLWSNYLAGILATVSKYPRIGIAVSVRSAYEDMVIPEGLSSDKIVRVQHQGFVDHEYTASRTFFSYYGIEAPSVPLLAHDFSNPLFLKLFCQGLKNKGLKKIPEGLQGVTAVFNFFLDSVHDKLCRTVFGPAFSKLNVVRKATYMLSEKMATSGSEFIGYEEAYNTVEEILAGLFEHLLSEGVLAEDRIYDSNTAWINVIRFSFERFSDHLIVQHLIDKHVIDQDLATAFTPGNPIGDLFADEWSCYRHRGLIDALSIQIPEAFSKEVLELVPQCKDWSPVQKAFVASIVWRSVGAFSSTTDTLVNNLIEDGSLLDEFLDAIITVASVPSHPYNAHRLHTFLLQFEMSDRDAWWTTYLHRKYGENGSVDSMVDWALSNDTTRGLDTVAIELVSITLSWFLTSSNRFIRDRATKGLVSILSNQLPVLRHILELFHGVDEPYVVERLFAVAYGTVLRSNDKTEIFASAKLVYSLVFEDRTPPCDVLLRDYARGVIEYALHVGMVDTSIDVGAIRPPYNSGWPDEIANKAALEPYAKKPGYSTLYNSVMGYDDFARYIIGTNSGIFEWLSIKLGEEIQTPDSIYNNFVKSLTQEQVSLLGKYQDLMEHRRQSGLLLSLKDIWDTEMGSSLPQLTKEDLKQLVESLETETREASESLVGCLDGSQRKIFIDTVVPFLDGELRGQDKSLFDLEKAQCYIFQRVLELGWTPEKFGEFDSNIDFISNRTTFRASHKAERIGKKYQWIAYRDFIARVSDNFVFKGDSWNDSCQIYEGPWQISYARDIDPSHILSTTSSENPHEIENPWWIPERYDYSRVDSSQWESTTSDLPNVEKLLAPINPENGEEWIQLELHYDWVEPTPPEEERYENPTRQIWYALRSYLVQNKDADAVYSWAVQQDFWGKWMPEARDLHNVYFGEFYWSPAYKYFNNLYQEGMGWITESQGRSFPGPLMVTSEHYGQEGNGYDCSTDEGITVYLPCQLLHDQMRLKLNPFDGRYRDETGNVVVMDPVMLGGGRNGLLARKDLLAEFLSSQGCSLIWTFIGEKQFVGGNTRPRDIRSLEITGAYRFIGGTIEGEYKANLRP